MTSREHFRLDSESDHGSPVEGGVLIAITQSTAATMFILISMTRSGMMTVRQRESAYGYKQTLSEVPDYVRFPSLSRHSLFPIGVGPKVNRRPTSARWLPSARFDYPQSNVHVRPVRV